MADPPRPALADVTNNVSLSEFLEKASSDERVRAASAVFSVKEAQLKANFKRQLEEVLAEVAETESNYDELKHKHDEGCKRQEDLSKRTAQLSADNKLLEAQLAQARAENAESFKALQTAEGSNRELKNSGASAAAILAEERRLRREEVAKAAQQAELLQQQQREALEQSHRMMKEIAVKDEQIAASASEAARAAASFKAAQEELARMEAVARATGERAAGAEATAAGRAESVNILHTELSKLREKFLSEISELKAARVQAAEAARLKEQVASSQAVAAALTESRDELRDAAATMTARYAGAEERARRLAAASAVRDTVLQALEGIALDGDATDALDAMSYELDTALRKLALSCGESAKLQAALEQQEACVKRMAQEASATDHRQHEKDEHNMQLQRIVVEMQAEMQRLAAQACLGPPIVLDMDTGRMMQLEAGQAEAHKGLPNKGVVSELETCATAVRVVLADRGYSVRALSANLAASPAMPLIALEAQQRQIQVAASDLDRQLDALSESLGARPLDVVASQEVLAQTQAGCRATITQMLAVRDQLATSQVEAVGLEECIGNGESALHTNAALLAGWSSFMGRLMAQGEGVDQATRLRLRDELKTAEEPLHRASTNLASSQVVGNSVGGQSMAAGDPFMADTAMAVREAQNVLLELAAKLPDSEHTGDSKLKAAVVNAEIALRERERALARFRERITHASAECAVLAGSIGGVVSEVQAMEEPLQHLAEVFERYLAAGNDVPLDPVALQGEVMALRGQLRSKERMIHEMELAGGVLRPAHERGMPRALVPLEALHACERVREDAESSRAEAQACLVKQRLRHGVCRLGFVHVLERERAEMHLLLVLLNWKGITLQSQVDRTSSSAAGLDQERARLAELAARRREALPHLLNRMADEHDAVLAHSTLLGWRLAVGQQVAARAGLERLVGLALNISHRFHGTMPADTVAQRLTASKLCLIDPWTPPPPAPSVYQLMRIALAAWRMYAATKRQSRKVASLSASLPMFVAAVGQRRRLERAWLAWRLYVACTLTEAADEQLLRLEQLPPPPPQPQPSPPISLYIPTSCNWAASPPTSPRSSPPKARGRPAASYRRRGDNSSRWREAPQTRSLSPPQTQEHQPPIWWPPGITDTRTWPAHLSPPRERSSPLNYGSPRNLSPRSAHKSEGIGAGRLLSPTSHRILRSGSAPSSPTKARPSPLPHGGGIPSCVEFQPLPHHHHHLLNQLQQQQHQHRLQQQHHHGLQQQRMAPGVDPSQIHPNATQATTEQAPMHTTHTTQPSTLHTTHPTTTPSTQAAAPTTARAGQAADMHRGSGSYFRPSPPASHPFVQAVDVVNAAGAAVSDGSHNAGRRTAASMGNDWSNRSAGTGSAIADGLGHGPMLSSSEPQQQFDPPEPQQQFGPPGPNAQYLPYMQTLLRSEDGSLHPSTAVHAAMQGLAAQPPHGEQQQVAQWRLWQEQQHERQVLHHQHRLQEQQAAYQQQQQQQLQQPCATSEQQYRQQCLQDQQMHSREQELALSRQQEEQQQAVLLQQLQAEVHKLEAQLQEQKEQLQQRKHQQERQALLEQKRALQAELEQRQRQVAYQLQCQQDRWPQQQVEQEQQEQASAAAQAKCVDRAPFRVGAAPAPPAPPLPPALACAPALRGVTGVAARTQSTPQAALHQQRPGAVPPQGPGGHGAGGRTNAMGPAAEIRPASASAASGSASKTANKLGDHGNSQASVVQQTKRLAHTMTSVMQGMHQITGMLSPPYRRLQISNGPSAEGQLPFPPAPTTSPRKVVAGLGDSTLLQFEHALQHMRTEPPSTTSQPGYSAKPAHTADRGSRSVQHSGTAMGTWIYAAEGGGTGARGMHDSGCGEAKQGKVEMGEGAGRGRVLPAVLEEEEEGEETGGGEELSRGGWATPVQAASASTPRQAAARGAQGGAAGAATRSPRPALAEPQGSHISSQPAWGANSNRNPRIRGVGGGAASPGAGVLASGKGNNNNNRMDKNKKSVDSGSNNRPACSPAIGSSNNTNGNQSSANNSRPGSGRGARCGGVPVVNRLQHSTITTQAKIRAGGLPGGLPNLIALPPPPQQPILAPLESTYAPQGVGACVRGASTPGPWPSAAELMKGTSNSSGNDKSCYSSGSNNLEEGLQGEGVERGRDGDGAGGEEVRRGGEGGGRGQQTLGPHPHAQQHQAPQQQHVEQHQVQQQDQQTRRQQPQPQQWQELQDMEVTALDLVCNHKLRQEVAACQEFAMPSRTIRFERQALDQQRRTEQVSNNSGIYKDAVPVTFVKLPEPARFATKST